ncbi:MAG: leucine--tRNA ligase [Pyrinomonadaceae bacterium]|nr:leucine--tRNA ligase [Pyrinomonadaceae bacterium]
MDEKYYPEKIEEKWQKFWEETRAFEVEADSKRQKFYCLEMLPYPSGFLHMGHVRNYSIGDALAWYKRLRGFNVLHPIGWDSFGQPAEQAAIKRNVNPREWTEENITQMRRQFKRLGISYDWRREVAAHRPEYYKWDQWFFLKMYERGLVYRRMSPVNWCPNEKTVLSNEQSSGGVCWRCGWAVEKKDLEQWFVRTTQYAEELIADMAELEAGWPERVLTMQRNWIARSTGAFVDFPVKDSTEKIRVFTTRIDTIYGANAIVLAPEHPSLAKLLEGSTLQADITRFAARVREGRATLKPDEEVEKEGMNTGLFATNPFSGEQLPVWVANYVLMDYGAGAVMSVPAHDERDFEFAQKYTLPIKQVIVPVTHDKEPSGFEPQLSEDVSTEMLNAMTDYGMLVNSGEWSARLSQDAITEMSAHAEKMNFGGAAVTYRLRDWGISRQRFWGAPIPMVYCETCGIVPIAEKDLPVELPASAEFTGTGESPLAGVVEFVTTTCPKCSRPARRDTDTMDTFVDSSWYFFRYCDPQNADAPFDKEKAKYWTPVDQYIGGIEHAVMHLLYTRFWTKMMRDIGLVSFGEPVKNLLTQGMVVAETFYREDEGKRVYFNPADVRVERDAKGRITSAVLISDNRAVTVGDIEKMSKSTNNGVDPNEMIDAYGADAVRVFTLFAAPPENELRWSEAGIDGAVRFLRRVYSMIWKWADVLANDSLGGTPQINETVLRNLPELRRLRQMTHRTIARVTTDFERLHFNTSVAALMELMNAVGDFDALQREVTEAPPEYHATARFVMREALEALVIMLAPFAPHAAEEMWAGLGHTGGILRDAETQARWPQADAVLARKEELEIPVQVNGKLRGRLRVAAETGEEDLRQAALADERVRGFIEGRDVVKVIVVPQRLVNIVVS